MCHLFIKHRISKKYNTEIGISDHTNDIKIPIYGKLLGKYYREAFEN